MRSMRPRSDLLADLGAAGVTPRELEIFWFVGDRLHNREIAELLHLSERTVESHVSSLLRKLGGANRQALWTSRRNSAIGKIPGVRCPSRCHPSSDASGRSRI